MITTGVKEWFSTQKVIAFVLLAASFLMLFLPWVNISIRIRGEKYDVNDVLTIGSGSSYREIEEDIYDELDDLSDELDWIGVEFKPQKAFNMVGLIADSHITAIDAARVCSYSSSVLNKIKKTADNLFGSSLASDIKKYEGLTRFFAIIMWFLVLATVIFFAYSVFSIIADMKNGVIFFVGARIALLIVSFIFCAVLNGQIMNFSDSLSDFFWAIEDNLPSNLHLFHISVADVLGVLFAVASFAFGEYGVKILPREAIPTEISSKINAVKTKIVDENTCSNCGAFLPIKATFCPKCGMKATHISEPENTCPYCGYAVGKDGRIIPRRHR